MNCGSGLTLPLITVCLAVCDIADLGTETSFPGTLIVGCSHKESHYEVHISRSESCGQLKMCSPARKHLKTSDVGD